MSPFPLRPLGFGELLDRAISIFVRAFVPFTALALVWYVPFAIAEACRGRGALAILDVVMKGTVGVASPGAYGRSSSAFWTVFDLALGLRFSPVCDVAAFACIVERKDLLGALRAGSRVVRRRPTRAVLAFGTYATILIALEAFALAVSRTVATFATPSVAYACANVTFLVAGGVRLAYVSALYLDLRIRDEGYDLLVAARALKPTSPSDGT